MACLLREAGAQGMAPEDAEKLLAHFERGDERRGAERPTVSSAARRGPSPLVEPLSQREIEVLRRVTEGLS